MKNGTHSPSRRIRPRNPGGATYWRKGHPGNPVASLHNRVKLEIELSAFWFPVSTFQSGRGMEDPGNTMIPSNLTAPLKFAPRHLVFALVLSIGLVCVAVAYAGDVQEELLLRGVAEQREFDYFKLALQWPGTYCRKTSKCCAQNGCCRGSNGPTGFTIHGLWADYNDGTWPSCCSGKKFDATEISTLREALYKYWPTLSCSKSKNCHGGKGLFWEHEV
ncbi:hypothetical protein SASPL_135750 [Salvia splendens]|uniref:Uncharacterized protein n=1 Tax=Salvia splendens TaxID=180675 RepID=A0A8X8ZG01_SALSN|nr:hypothetical protein SASPL_135750 [Salvia splendens]